MLYYEIRPYKIDNGDFFIGMIKKNLRRLFTPRESLWVIKEMPCQHFVIFVSRTCAVAKTLPRRSIVNYCFKAKTYNTYYLKAKRFQTRFIQTHFLK